MLMNEEIKALSAAIGTLLDGSGGVYFKFC